LARDAALSKLRIDALSGQLEQAPSFGRITTMHTEHTRALLLLPITGYGKGEIAKPEMTGI